MRSHSSRARFIFIFLLLNLVVIACALPGSLKPTTPTPAPGVPTVPEVPGNPPTNTPVSQSTQVNIYLIALDDGGKSGPAIGCGDSLVEVKQDVAPTSEPVRAALEALFAIKQKDYGESGLYNALWQSNLTVLTTSIDANGVANITLGGTYLLGGVCDNPRFKGQIVQTIMAVPGVQSANVTINGQPIDQVLSEK